MSDIQPEKETIAAKSASEEKEAPYRPLLISSSPHALTDENIPKIMYSVVAALFPASAVSIYFFGLRALMLLVVCTLSCVFIEYLLQKFSAKKIAAHDGSAAITGMLLALNLPPSFPVFGAILGSVFAIAIGKQIFGGLGFNIFNPALLGRAFLMATYPVLITTWTEPSSLGIFNGVDAISAATPLAKMKFEAISTPLLDLFFGNVAGSLGETSALAILIRSEERRVGKE